MKPLITAFDYTDNEHSYKIQKQLENWLLFDLYVQIQSEKFVEYQREIFEEFVADFLDQAQDAGLSEQDVEMLLQAELQNLNHKLQSFAEKLRDVPKCEVRGYVQVIVNQRVLVWMIGKSTLMFFRNEKLLTELENAYQEQALIDQFVDFIGGEFETGDQFLYVGTKLSDYLDHQDLNDMEAVLESENGEAMLQNLEETLLSRGEKTEIWFLHLFSVKVGAIKLPQKTSKSKVGAFVSQYTKKIGAKIDFSRVRQQIQRLFKGNAQYYIMSGILACVVLLLGYAVFSQFRGLNKGIEYITGTGGTAHLTLEDVRKDIVAFNLLDPSTDEKSQKYAEILGKIQILESNNAWPEDVKILKESLEANYERGFNVRLVKDFSQFDDAQRGVKTQIFTLTEAEKAKIWTPISLDIGSQKNIAGTRGALLGITNENSRGNLIEFNASADAKDCSLSLSKKGLFCHTVGGQLFYVGKAGVELMETTDGQRSTSDVGAIGTYNKSSMYLFQHSPNNFASVFLTRYQNIAGSESQYRAGQNYTVLTASGVSLPNQMEGFVIDGNFMAWGDGKLYQFWRSSPSSTRLDYREVNLLWGEKSSARYSNNVKILASDTSPYVHLFDKDHQTFTVYKSTPPKTQESHTKNFNLRYVMRLKFNLPNTRVLDVEIPPTNDEKRELFLLTNEGVYKINLYEFLARIKAPSNQSFIAP